jgi:hypothetical protein
MSRRLIHLQIKTALRAELAFVLGEGAATTAFHSF